MKREEFLKKTSLGCLALITGSVALSGCAGMPSLTLPVESGLMKVPKSSFEIEKKGKVKQLRQVMLKNQGLEYPILLQKHSDTSYKALLLRCTHQGTELNVYGDLIGCPAHGSEFNNQGGVIQGPAKEQLKSFPVNLTSDHIIISLS